jgi:hypothetical protein
VKLRKTKESRTEKISNKYRNKIITICIIWAIIASMAIVSYKLDNTTSSIGTIDSIGCDSM